MEGVGGGAEPYPGHPEAAGEGVQATSGEGKAAVGGIFTGGIEHWVSIFLGPLVYAWASTSGGRG